MDNSGTPDSPKADRYDVVVVGGGLAGGLLARAFAERRDRTVALLEAGPRLGGNHTWSFHDRDVPPAGWRLVDDLIGARWDGYTVRFPSGQRLVRGGYFSISSATYAIRLNDALRRAGTRVLLGARAHEVDADRVVLADGTVLAATLVIDARGPEPEAAGHASCGFQKFVGLEVELAAPGGLDLPVLMDATVPQPDGFHFVYVLPFTDRRWLVEHTVYANDPLLDRADLRRRVLEQIAGRGLRIAEIVREEEGVLPLPWRPAPKGGDPTGVASRGPLVVGYRGGWFHPVTGYSFPAAIRLAVAAAEAESLSAFRAAAGALWQAHERQASFGRLLNRLMFTAIRPTERWRLLARFYALPVETIERFYAMRSTTYDRLRLLAGRPPRGLSVRAALFPKEPS